MKQKVHKKYGIFFIFIFSLLATLVIDIAIRKSSLGNLPLKKVVSGSFKHWSYQTDSSFFLPLSF